MSDETRETAADEPDVEAHLRGFDPSEGRTADAEDVAAADDEPDVEAHIRSFDPSERRTGGAEGRVH